jgi:hypothetical protein
MFYALCFYLILVHGLKFNGELEVAWVIASLVAITQELLVHQVLALVFSSTLRQLIVPSITKTFLPTADNQGLASVAELGDPTHPQALKRRVRKARLSKPKEVARETTLFDM